MNRVDIVGRLARDPEFNQTAGGIPYCKFTVAVDRQYKQADGSKGTDFIDCVAWRTTAEFLHKYFTKGKAIGLTGSIETGSYEKDGVRHYTTKVKADTVEFVGSKEQSGNQGSGNYQSGGNQGGGNYQGNYQSGGNQNRQRGAQRPQYAGQGPASYTEDVFDDVDFDPLSDDAMPF